MNVTDNAYLAENVVVLDKTLGFRQGPKEELLTLKIWQKSTVFRLIFYTAT